MLLKAATIGALISYGQEVEAAEAAVVAAQKKSGPTLDAEFATSYYEREAATRDKVRAALNLRIPIYQGGRDDADVAAMQAQLHNPPV